MYSALYLEQEQHSLNLINARLCIRLLGIMFKNVEAENNN